MGLRRSHLLVVEDDPDILGIMREGLTGEGYRVSGVATPEAALTALRRGGIDLVIADAFRPLALAPAEARWATLGRLRAAAGATPIVIATAHQPGDYADFAERGFAAFLAKPFDLDELFETVRLALGGG